MARVARPGGVVAACVSYGSFADLFAPFAAGAGHSGGGRRAAADPPGASRERQSARGPAEEAMRLRAQAPLLRLGARPWLTPLPHAHH